MKAFYFLVILFVALSCQNVKYPEKPDNLIPEDKMVEVLTEVYLSNATRTKDIRVARKAGYMLDSMLYKKFDIDSSQFANSHAYYSTDIDEYTAMFKRVKEKLNILKVGADSIKAQYDERRRILDSIKKDSLRKIELKKAEDSVEVSTPFNTQTEVESNKLIPAVQGI